MQRISTLKYIPRTRNWGDYIAPYIYRKISNSKPKLIPMEEQSGVEHCLSVGSVLRMADNNSHVWGSGFLCENDGLGILSWRKTNNEVLSKPNRILAVRGPKTKAKLNSMGIDCPDVFGDPALLLPNFYQPKTPKKFKLGIIPHYTERKKDEIRQFSNHSEVKVINVLMSRFEQVIPSDRKYTRVLDEIASCEYVVSGSLHGLIVADAYGVPAAWMEINNHKLLDNFKYFDYFSSVGRPEEPPFQLTMESRLQEILDSIKPFEFKFDPQPLLDACPFRA